MVLITSRFKIHDAILGASSVCDFLPTNIPIWPASKEMVSVSEEAMRAHNGIELSGGTI